MGTYLFPRLGDVATDYVSAGDTLYVEGSLQPSGQTQTILPDGTPVLTSNAVRYSDAQSRLQSTLAQYFDVQSVQIEDDTSWFYVEYTVREAHAHLPDSSRLAMDIASNTFNEFGASIVDGSSRFGFINQQAEKFPDAPVYTPGYHPPNTNAGGNNNSGATRTVYLQPPPQPPPAPDKKDKGLFGSLTQAQIQQLFLLGGALVVLAVVAKK